MVTSPNRPPSCDLLANENDPNVLASEISARMRRRQKVIHQEPRPKLKECPACANRNQQQNDDFVECKDCGLWGPEDDPHGTKWNSIPRRLEVAEFLRLVDETIISPPTPAEGRLLQYATKLMKEWNL